MPWTLVIGDKVQHIMVYSVECSLLVHFSIPFTNFKQFDNCYTNLETHLDYLHCQIYSFSTLATWQYYRGHCRNRWAHGWKITSYNLATVVTDVHPGSAAGHFTPSTVKVWYWGSRLLVGSEICNTLNANRMIKRLTGAFLLPIDVLRIILADDQSIVCWVLCHQSTNTGSEAPCPNVDGAPPALRYTVCPPHVDSDGFWWL